MATTMSSGMGTPSLAMKFTTTTKAVEVAARRKIQMVTRVAVVFRSSGRLYVAPLTDEDVCPKIRIRFSCPSIDKECHEFEAPDSTRCRRHQCHCIDIFWVAATRTNGYTPNTVPRSAGQRDRQQHPDQRPRSGYRYTAAEPSGKPGPRPTQTRPATGAKDRQRNAEQRVRKQYRHHQVIARLRPLQTFAICLLISACVASRADNTITQNNYGGGENIILFGKFAPKYRLAFSSQPSYTGSLAPFAQIDNPNRTNWMRASGKTTNTKPLSATQLVLPILERRSDDQWVGKMGHQAGN